MKDPSAHMISGGSQLQFAPSVQAYLAAITRICAEGEYAIASVILFGSVAASDFRGSVSDVDLILVLHDDASPGKSEAALESCDGS
jgi:predicted nucleotidyltransferase